VKQAATEQILGFEEAVALVRRHAAEVRATAAEMVALGEASGRVLTEELQADRDMPPFERATRDGYAVRAAELMAGALRVSGSLRAGEAWVGGALGAGEAIEIMTGAAVPAEADAVVMLEHVTATTASQQKQTQEQKQNQISLREGRAIAAGENIVPQGSEARQGQALLAAGTRLDAAGVGLAAVCGAAELRVWRRPRVGILATGDELVKVNAKPGPQQIRDSNSHMLAALVEAAGGVPVRLPAAADTREALAAGIEAARDCEMLVLSGGVSAGRHDLVEAALEEAGAEFYFTVVRMQPGRPVVFGAITARRDGGRQYFFGLPGNPVSTEVTFLTLARGMVQALGGAAARGPRLLSARLAEAVRGKAGLTRFVPAVWSQDWSRPEVRAIATQGSGDLAADARAECYVVVAESGEGAAAGDTVNVLPR
jgi:molybdopterin molybdotransferase